MDRSSSVFIAVSTLCSSSAFAASPTTRQAAAAARASSLGDWYSNMATLP